MTSDKTPRFRRPAMLYPAFAEGLPGGPDPATLSEIAHATAEALVTRGRGSDDPEVFHRILSLVEDEGIEVVASVWAHSPAESLPGALWRLFTLREWIRLDARVIAERYALGVHVAEVEDAIAGVAKPPGPEEVQTLIDEVFSGVFSGDFAVALERAAAFCRVLVPGSALDADWVETTDEDAAIALTHRATSLQGTAHDLEAAAGLWRAGRLT